MHQKWQCPVLCFFGDSITGRHKDLFATKNGCSGRNRIGKRSGGFHAGVGGNFSKDGLARIQQDVLEKQPDFCCVMFGTNDVTNAYKGDSALQEYEKNMKQTIRLRTETVLMTPGMLWHVSTDILKTCKRLGTWMLPKSERLPTNWIFRLQMHMPNAASRYNCFAGKRFEPSECRNAQGICKPSM